MHIHTLQKWQHAHRFHIDQARAERNTWRVIGLTAAVMIVEIVAGLRFGSMALLADGWHMGTHVAALGITVFAYAYARRHADDEGYTFGTGKVGALGGFASAIALAIVALLMAAESVQRLFVARAIQFDEAIAVAVVGLLVNLACAYMLRDTDHHGHGHHAHEGGAHAGHHDQNLRAAYLHVLADALTSVLAIVALLAGKALGWIWLDAVMGVVGAAVITRWAYGLLRDTSQVLLDGGVDPETVSAIRSSIEADADNRVADLHVWRVGSHQLAVLVSVVTHYPKPPDRYKELLAEFGVVHVTVEVQPCASEPCLPLQGARI